jgi:chlorite dismutase
MLQILVRGTLSAVILAVPAGSVLAADREQLLTQPGVYATFAVFKVEGDWWRLDKPTRESGAAAVKEVFRKHGEKAATDTYLLRGLSESADLMIRVHAAEMAQIQNFLLDLMGSPLGKYLRNTHTFNGITKQANYVPRFPDEVKAALKTPVEPGEKSYVIVIPIRKDAEWWLLDRQTRTTLMQEHTEASLPYLKTVKRKLYHSSGLDDFDFITYFETAKLDDFNALLIALESVKENRYNKRVGAPTLLGTIRPLDEILGVFTQ